MKELRQFIPHDGGPLFVAWCAIVRGVPVCVVTPSIFTNPVTRQVAREILKRQGVDCDACRSCPLWRER